MGIAKRRVSPSDPEQAIREGEAALARNQFDQALQAFEKAREAAPNDARVLIPLGWVSFLTQKGDPDPKALIETGIAMKQDRLLAARGHYYLGKIFEQEGSQKKAQENFVKAVELNPGFVAAIEALKQLAG